MAPIRLTTRAEREAQRAIKRVCHAGFDSVALREAVARHSAGLVPTEACAITATDPDTGLFTHGWVNGLPEPFVRTYLTHLYADEVVEFLDLVRSGRTTSTRTTPDYRAVLGSAGLGHRAQAVLCSGGEMWGTWCMFREPGSRGFSERELRFVRAVAPHVGYGMRAAALIERAHAAPEDAGADVPGVLVLDARRRVNLRGGPVAAQLEDLATVGMPAESLPFAVLSLLADFELAARRPDRAPATRLRAQGRSGRWYQLHATLAEPDASGAAATIVVIEPATVRPGAAALAHLYGLTDRERDVVLLVLRGDSTKRIGTRLGLSSHTVQDHLRNACGKVGVRGRRALMARLFADGCAPASA